MEAKLMAGRDLPVHPDVPPRDQPFLRGPLSTAAHSGLCLQELLRSLSCTQPLRCELPHCHFYRATQPRACAPRWLQACQPLARTVTLSSEPHASSGIHQPLPQLIWSLLLPLPTCSFLFSPRAVFSAGRGYEGGG